MDAIRGYTKNPLAMLVIGLVVGSIIGLVVLGWWLWPVKWVDAGPQHLNIEQKEGYLRQAIEAFGYNSDSGKAIERYNSLGDDAASVLNKITQNPGDINPDIIIAFAGAVSAPQIVGEIQPPAAEPAAGQETGQPAGSAVEPAAGTLVAPAGVPVQPGVTPAEEEKGGVSFWLVLLLVLLGLAVVAAFVYFFVLRGRLAAGEGEPAYAKQADDYGQEAVSAAYPPAANEPPIAQFTATYRLGDDLFDDSFSIDSTTGEFLGECGVGISETIGVGDPKKVTAFEAWLFDKNDIQTVTKVLMSEHAFYDTTTRQRLDAKGELALAQQGSEIVLDTQTLQLVARVIKMEYGDGAMPDNSYFKTFQIELAVWPKEEM